MIFYDSEDIPNSEELEEDEDTEELEPVACPFLTPYYVDIVSKILYEHWPMKFDTEDGETIFPPDEFKFEATMLLSHLPPYSAPQVYSVFHFMYNHAAEYDPETATASEFVPLEDKFIEYGPWCQKASNAINSAVFGMEVIL